MSFKEWSLIVALLLGHACILFCRCARKTGNSNIAAMFALIVSAAPFILGRFAATLFLVGFSLSLISYFEWHYERRLRTIGRIANEIGEMPEQGGLLLLLAGEIVELLCRNNFRFHQSVSGQQAFLSIAAHPDVLTTGKDKDEALYRALRFIHADIVGKWGSPPPSHSVSLLLERINRNVLFYLATAKSGNMADIHTAARKNLGSLFGIYYRNFHLQRGNPVDWGSAEAFAQLRRQFETKLEKFPVRMELA